MGTTSVDPHALRSAALRLDAAGDLLDAAIRGPLSDLQLRTVGPSVRSALGLLVEDVAGWRRAARDGACVLRAAAAEYLESDRLGAQVLQ